MYSASLRVAAYASGFVELASRNGLPVFLPASFIFIGVAQCLKIKSPLETGERMRRASRFSTGKATRKNANKKPRHWRANPINMGGEFGAATCS
jgi:hypothetical protein